MFMDPCIVADSVEIPTRCKLVIEFIIPKFIEFIIGTMYNIYEIFYLIAVYTPEAANIV